MALTHLAEPRGRLVIPLGTLLAAVVLALGLATGLHLLGNSTTPAAVATSPAAPISGTGGPDDRFVPARNLVVPSDVCKGLDPTAVSKYCNPARPLPVATPRAAWIACAGMDARGYRMYCSADHGDRSSEVPEPN